jgi:hypothetical protein
VIPRRRLLAPLTRLALLTLLPACGGTTAPAPTAAPTAAPAAVSTAAPAAASTPAGPASPAVIPTAPAPAAAPTAAPTAAPAAKPAAKPAPELEGLQWYNSPPLKLVELRGRPVLLVFWSTI